MKLLAASITLAAVFLIYGQGDAAVAAESTSERDARLYDLCSSHESLISTALQTRDSSILNHSVDALGAEVEEAFSRKDHGILASSCDIAVQSLHFIALLSDQAISSGDDEWVEIVSEEVKEAAQDYDADFIECANSLRRDPGVRANLSLLQ